MNHLSTIDFQGDMLVSGGYLMMKFEPQKFDVLVFPFIKKGDVVQLFKGMNRFLTSYFPSGQFVVI